MTPKDIPGAVALQRSCFPPPFPAEQLWNASHLRRHLEIFPEGQLVAEEDGQIVASASNCIVSEENWLSHQSWEGTVGGPYIRNHDPNGTTLYGLDVSVHPKRRGRGIMRALYQARFELVRGRLALGAGCLVRGVGAPAPVGADTRLPAPDIPSETPGTRHQAPAHPRLLRYGTAVRIPGFRSFKLENPEATPDDYVQAVARGEVADRTLTPMLRVGLNLKGVIENYMEDPESQNAAAVLEWRP